ncbi:hypothetical protein BDW59DRAFT_92146 [Aspergillus cavernicola]|uniref:DUF7770 domain-containing protein n=1 Tax=Aspergillus cavernicola TaxID=176166 RepID=A0ABR4IAB3_9EURO
MATFQPIHFIPKHREPQILSLSIQNIITGPHYQDAGTNHWCFYLETRQNTFIQLDCLPSYSIPSTILPGGSKANLIISELETTVSPDIQARFVLGVPPSQNTTVKNLLDILVENGRHKYEFDFKGVGCRYRVTDQVELLYQNGLVVDRAQIETVKAAIVKLWPEKSPLELDRGAYYQ